MCYDIHSDVLMEVNCYKVGCNCEFSINFQKFCHSFPVSFSKIF